MSFDSHNVCIHLLLLPCSQTLHRTWDIEVSVNQKIVWLKALNRCAQLLIGNISWLLTNTQILDCILYVKPFKQESVNKHTNKRMDGRYQT